MTANSHQARRRTHSAEFKTKVLGQCREPGASVASVALANGVNANLVRSWMSGRGLKRQGVDERSSVVAVGAMQPLQFMPVEVTSSASAGADGDAAAGPEGAEVLSASIHVEMRCGDASLAVQWPLSRASECSLWLSGLASAVLKR